MSSKGWNIVGDVANVEAIAWTIVGSVATAAYQKSVPASDSMLELCRKDLEEVKTRLNELTPERREEIRILAEQQKCSSFEKLEQDLDRLSNDRCEMSLRAAESSHWQRCMPLSQLRRDITWLRNAVLKLRNDTWNTTTFPSKEARRHAQLQGGHPEPSSPHHPSPGRSPADGPGSETTRTTGSSPHTGGRPEEHPLDVIRPAPVYMMTRHGVANLPEGIV